MVSCAVYFFWRAYLEPVFHTRVHALRPEAIGSSGKRRERQAARHRRREVQRIDVQVDLVGGPGHGAPVEDVVADVRPPVAVHLIAELQAQLRNQGERVALKDAAVGADGEYSRTVRALARPAA